VKNKNETIRKVVGYLNNPQHDGGFWLPNIQRPFVWTEEQICRLFDSILRQYPISTLLVWKTKSEIKRRRFISDWKDHLSLQLSDFSVTSDKNIKCLVLDGQQRLQSLYIGLHGSYNKRQLYFDVASGEVAAPDDIKFRFAFLEPGSDAAKFPMILFRDQVFSTAKRRERIDAIVNSAPTTLDTEIRQKIEDHIDLIDQTFTKDEAITYQELDSIDNEKLYDEDDVVEVFIRANSGGTRLGKSDLLFSLLQAGWDEADERMDELLETLNKPGFAFDRDFVLKTALTLLNQGARYEVDKFRKTGVREELSAKWGDIAGAITAVLDWVRGKTYIQCDKALPSYLALIPLIYFRYHHPKGLDTATNLDGYLLRTSLTSAFSGNPDNVLDSIVNRLKGSNTFDVAEVFAVILSLGRSLELTPDRLWQLGYGSDSIHLLFNWWYRDFNHTPAYENNFPQIDHIFPQSVLSKIKVENPLTGKRNKQKYPMQVRNQLANCMLLSREENGAGGKWDTLPEDWFANKSPEYLAKHLIPADPALWKLDQFEAFIEARKQLIVTKLAPLISGGLTR
jgi:uncharacterized protein with ParB-like and HNH nuclease domain